jgi:hypothetical protein
MFDNCLLRNPVFMSLLRLIFDSQAALLCSKIVKQKRPLTASATSLAFFMILAIWLALADGIDFAHTHQIVCTESIQRVSVMSPIIAYRLTTILLFGLFLLTFHFNYNNRHPKT